MGVDRSSLFKRENNNQELRKTKRTVYFTPPDGQVFLHQDINLTNFHKGLR